MKKDGSDHEWLSFAPVPRDVICGHFANIRARCLEDGRDIVDEPIPVVPTQHYFMGGVWVNRDSATSMPGLYAAGDCTGGLLQVAKAVYEGAQAGTEAAKALRKG